MNRLNELRYLKARRRLIERAIARRQLAPLMPWFKILDDSDYDLVREWLKQDKAARPVFEAEHERLAHIITEVAELFDSGGKPADFEARLYPERVARRAQEQAEQERERLERLELDRQKWLETYSGSNQVLKLAAKNWLLGKGFDLPGIQQVVLLFDLFTYSLGL